MTSLPQIRNIVGDILELGDQIELLTADSPLRNGFPGFDSMAVVSILYAIENRFGFEVEDDEISGEIFETLGSLADFVDRKRAA